MKTRFFIPICILLFSCTTLFAQKKQDKNTVKYVKVDEANHTKEYIAYNKRNKETSIRTVYQYDDSNNRIKRTTYMWNNSKREWVEARRYEYINNKDNQLAYIVYTKWDKDTNRWADKSELLIHLYDKDGKFVAIQKVEMNSQDNSLLSLK
ncbi:DUF3836 domain-containing protein [Dysgonomonas sp. 521]|uniref:DUF3836 domain-containing protein n=1 Tax=Dysgonomonas sp. 521 TaxID=2302932 RepID=UPI0013D26E6A|nr:DUF3836 domain-containing protein [Dysgonomonas sp. 521]NDV96284.1 DUF3836 domain-containing protein [Dysgonomonas sp. 521]